MKGKQSKFTLRINEELLKKFRYISEYNARSANSELTILIRKHIAEFEKSTEKYNTDYNFMPSYSRQSVFLPSN